MTTVWAVAESVRGPSRTAVLTAVAHEVYSEEPSPLIFDDVWAMGLAGPEGPALAQRLRRDLPPSHLCSTPLASACSTRSSVNEIGRTAGAKGQQYVILGAGLDSFRLPAR
jgi:O-methyltransferase involved in polyketide biosynthesis